MEIATLLSGYLLSPQGDRMLMAHSVEGRFPFLDRDVVALAASLPDRYKLAGLDEKRVLKRVAEGLVPKSILERPKQPYRSPDAAAFVLADAPGWVEESLKGPGLRGAGIFNPEGVQALWQKSVKRRERGNFSNADNMALVGVLSTQLLWERLVLNPPDRGGAFQLGYVHDHRSAARGSGAPMSR